MASILCIRNLGTDPSLAEKGTVGNENSPHWHPVVPSGLLIPTALMTSVCSTLEVWEGPRMVYFVKSSQGAENHFAGLSGKSFAWAASSVTFMVRTVNPTLQLRQARLWGHR